MARSLKVDCRIRSPKRRTYAVLDLGSRRAIFARSLDRNPLLAVHRLARDKVGRGKEVFLAAAGDEHTLVTMGLDNDLLAALRTGAALALAAATTASAISMLNEQALGRVGLRTLRDHREHHHVRAQQEHLRDLWRYC